MVLTIGRRTGIFLRKTGAKMVILPLKHRYNVT